MDSMHVSYVYLLYNVYTTSCISSCVILCVGSQFLLTFLLGRCTYLLVQPVTKITLGLTTSYILCHFQTFLYTYSVEVEETGVPITGLLIKNTKNYTGYSTIQDIFIY